MSKSNILMVEATYAWRASDRKVFSCLNVQIKLDLFNYSSIFSSGAVNFVRRLVFLSIVS